MDVWVGGWVGLSELDGWVNGWLRTGCDFCGEKSTGNIDHERTRHEWQSTKPCEPLRTYLLTYLLACLLVDPLLQVKEAREVVAAAVRES
jgi:hypothetical protein